MASIAAIRARRLEISEAIARLKAEDDELAVAEHVLVRLSDVATGPWHSQTGPAETISRSQQVPRSQREFVLDALAHSDAAWLKSGEIVAVTKKRWGVTISERSLRPLLSVMKRDGQIVRQGRVLALRDRVRGFDRDRRSIG